MRKKQNTWWNSDKFLFPYYYNVYDDKREKNRKEKERQTGRQTGRQTDRQTEKQTEIEKDNINIWTNISILFSIRIFIRDKGNTMFIDLEIKACIMPLGAL